MPRKAQAKTVRRSFALSSKLIDEALMVAPATEKVNLNKLVTIALQEYVNSKKRRWFEKSMLAMGSDPEILRECGAVAKEFARTENDGLSRNK
jgi:hypothetical protein